MAHLKLISANAPVTATSKPKKIRLFLHRQLRTSYMLAPSSTSVVLSAITEGGKRSRPMSCCSARSSGGKKKRGRMFNKKTKDKGKKKIFSEPPSVAIIKKKEKTAAARWERAKNVFPPPHTKQR